MSENDRPYHWKQTHEKYIPREVERHVEVLDLPESIGELAGKVHQQAIDADYSHRDADALASALVFAATRLQGAGVGISEVAEVSRKDEKLVHSTYRSLNRELGLNIQPNDAEPFVRRYADKLGFDEDSTERCARLVQQAKEDGLDAEMTPQSLAASIAYIVSMSDGYGHTQAEIQDVTGVAESTLRNHWRDITDRLQVHVPSRKGMNVHSRKDEPDDLDRAWKQLSFELNPPEELLSKARSLVEQHGDGSDKSPAGIVAGAFWVVTRDLQETEPREQRYIVGQAELAHALGVSTSTVQNRAKEFREQT